VAIASRASASASSLVLLTVTPPDSSGSATPKSPVSGMGREDDRETRFQNSSANSSMVIPAWPMIDFKIQGGRMVVS
jgi:hypothetical protein